MKFTVSATLLASLLAAPALGQTYGGQGAGTYDPMASYERYRSRGVQPQQYGRPQVGVRDGGGGAFSGSSAASQSLWGLQPDPYRPYNPRQDAVRSLFKDW